MLLAPVSEARYVASGEQCLWASKLDNNVRRDGIVNAALADAGWTVLRLWGRTPIDVAARAVVKALASLTVTVTAS